jgi:hypothetical protein
MPWVPDREDSQARLCADGRLGLPQTVSSGDRHVPRGCPAKALLLSASLRTTERAGAHSLQFRTYDLWTAWLLAALAVRPVPSCIASLTRGVNDQAPNDVCLGQIPADVEYWIPAEDLTALNASIAGTIEVTAEHH